MSYRRQTFITNSSKHLNLEDSNPIVINLEKGIFNKTINECKELKTELKWGNPVFTKIYSTHARRILANISYNKNADDFKNKILSGQIKSYDVVNCSREEMYPELWSELHLNNMKKYLVKQEEISDGMFTCNSCKSKKTVYYQMQTRSADEPMTTFVTCMNCNKKWKC